MSVSAPVCGRLKTSPGDDSRVVEETLVVDALTADETRDLAATLLGADSPDAATRADWVVEESGGSALFIYELVQHLQAGMDFFEAGKVHLDEILWPRIQRLPEQPSTAARGGGGGEPAVFLCATSRRSLNSGRCRRSW